MLEAVHAAREAAKARTAWRIEGTLREFPRFDPLNLWFDYPVHRPDSTGALSDVEPEGEGNRWAGKAGRDRRTKSPEERKKERRAALEEAFSACDMGGGVTVKDVSEFMGVTEKTVRNRIKEPRRVLDRRGLRRSEGAGMTEGKKRVFSFPSRRLFRREATLFSFRQKRREAGFSFFSLRGKKAGNPAFFPREGKSTPLRGV